MHCFGPSGKWMLLCRTEATWRLDDLTPREHRLRQPKLTTCRDLTGLLGLFIGIKTPRSYHVVWIIGITHGKTCLLLAVMNPRVALSLRPLGEADAARQD